MWIKRDFQAYLPQLSALPVKVLKGPRQVGKTSLLQSLGSHQTVYLDDATTRIHAQENPRFFLDNLPNSLILDEGPLAPALFSEIKRRVDQERRNHTNDLDYWITGSNQTLLQKNVRESLAGRASYFDLNTLSLHELGARWSFNDFLIRGGWPELYVSEKLNPVRYLNDLISTFIENDIVRSAGIERKEAFIKTLRLTAARIGQLFNVAEVATVAGAEATTIKSWLTLLEDNGIIRSLTGYYTNINKRLIKAPKIYLEDIALATRLQGWTEVQPILLSPVVGHLFENLVLNEIVRFFLNRGESPQINYIRSKEKVEVDFIVHLPNQHAVAIEVKMTPQDFTEAQLSLLAKTDLQIIERWVVSPTPCGKLPHSRALLPMDLFSALAEILT